MTANDPTPQVVRYAFRAFDRQWILADPRVLALQRPPLWLADSSQQVYMVGLLAGTIGAGPAVVAASAIPDKHYFRGSFGGKDVIPLYRDADGSPNVTEGLLAAISASLASLVSAEDLFAYVYAVLSSRRYVELFWDELEQPGPRVPITTDRTLFEQAVQLGGELLALHTFHERFKRSGKPERLGGDAGITEAIGPKMPETYHYDRESNELHVGAGCVSPVRPEIWEFDVSGLQVVASWLHYRMRQRTGKARSSRSPLDQIRPKTWPHEFTVELLEVIWTLEHTFSLEAQQTSLVDAICAAETLPRSALPLPDKNQRAHPMPTRRRGRRTRVSADQLGLDHAPE